MSATLIEWTHRPGTIGEVWNIVTGCNKVDRGCKNCYALVMHRRLQFMNPKKYDHDFLTGAHMHPDLLDLPYHWKKPRTVFVNSMSDLFHPDVPFEFLLRAFEVMTDCPAHTFLILTKRPENAIRFWEWMRKNDPAWMPPPNVWMGTSANDQASANKRIPLLLCLDSCLRFLSYEPATGPVDLTDLLPSGYGVNALNGVLKVLGSRGVEFRPGNALHWVLCGGESGAKADPMHPAWARKVRDDCKNNGVAFFFKQQGSWEPINYRNDGMEITVKFALGKGERLMTDPLQNMIRAKKKSGNLLDGQTYLEFPDTEKIFNKWSNLSTGSSQPSAFCSSSAST